MATWADRGSCPCYRLTCSLQQFLLRPSPQTFLACTSLSLPTQGPVSPLLLSFPVPVVSLCPSPHCLAIPG